MDAEHRTHTDTFTIAPGTRVVMANAWPAAEWYGTVAPDHLTPGDTRVPVRLDSGALVLYPRNQVWELAA